jgi:hypothetical protein
MMTVALVIAEFALTYVGLRLGGGAGGSRDTQIRAPDTTPDDQIYT